MDKHLLHLWGARRGLTKRWKMQRHNRKLKQRIARITAEAEEYAETLTKNSWHNFCDRLNGTLSTSKTWSILRALLNTTHTGTHTNNTIRTILHKEQMDDDDLLRTLQQRYISTGPRPEYKDYPHKEETDLDTDITEAEVRAALLGIRRNTSRRHPLCTTTQPR